MKKLLRNKKKRLNNLPRAKKIIFVMFSGCTQTKKRFEKLRKIATYDYNSFSLSVVLTIVGYIRFQTFRKVLFVL